MRDPRDEPAVIEYVGVDGSRWTVSGRGMGEQGVELGKKPRGLYSASGKAIWNSSAFQEGSTFEGLRWEPRDMVFAFNIFGNDGEDWEETYARWARAWAFDKTGTLRHTSTLSGTREIEVQLLEVQEFEPDFDPRLQAFGEVVMTIRAGKPWWRTESDYDSFVFNGRNFAGGGITVFNPTDRPLRLKWALKGPARWLLPDINLEGQEDRDRVVRMPFQRIGWDVVVNTDPHRMTATCPQNPNYWALMGGQKFIYEIPPNTPSTFLPIYIDPLPVLPFTLPVEWSVWLAEQITMVLSGIPDGTIFDTTPEMLAQWIADRVRDFTPDFLEDFSDIFGELIPSKIAQWITEAYGSMNNMAGASATVEMPREWMGPWGLGQGAYR